MDQKPLLLLAFCAAVLLSVGVGLGDTGGVTSEALRAEEQAVLNTVRTLPEAEAPARFKDQSGGLEYWSDWAQGDAQYAAAYARFRQDPAVKKMLASNPYFGIRKGTELPIEVLAMGSREYVFASVCQPHLCSSNYLLLLYDVNENAVSAMHVRDLGNNEFDRDLLPRATMTDRSTALLMVLFSRRAAQVGDLTDPPFPLSSSDRAEVEKTLGRAPTR